MYANMKTLAPKLLHKMDVYWRPTNYLSVGRIYLYDNLLLIRPLTLADVKHMLLGALGHPESDHGIGNKQKKDDKKIRPMPGYRRKDHSSFDHPRDGTRKICEEFQGRIGFLFFNLIRPILGQPFLRHGLTEAGRR